MKEFFQIAAITGKSIQELEKVFDAIPVAERQERVEKVIHAMTERKEHSFDPNKVLSALLNKEACDNLLVYPEVYLCSYQLPFSKESLGVRLTQEGVLHYSLDENNTWNVWKGEREEYERILSGKFGHTGPFYDQLCRDFIQRTFEEVYRNGTWYFKNLEANK